MDKFITVYKNNDFILQKKAQTAHNASLYFDFILNVNTSHGIERMNLIRKEMEEWDLYNLPKVVRVFLDEYKEMSLTDDEADDIFDEYCNKIRIANKLIKEIPVPVSPKKNSKETIE